MATTSGSNHTSFLFATVAIATASATVIAYRTYWNAPERKGHNGKDQPSKSSFFQSQKPNASIVKPPLRHVTPLPGEKPRIVYLTGIGKQTDEAELVELFSIGAPPIEIDASEVSFQKVGGRAWAQYSTAEGAKKTTAALHGKLVRGCSLCARLEYGVEKNGKRITDKTVHTAVLRGIQPRRGTPKKAGMDTSQNPKKKKKKNKSKQKQKQKQKQGTNNLESSSEYTATYSHNSILIGEIEYPFPSGIYSTKLIQRLSASIENKENIPEQDVKLLRLLSDISIIGCGSVQKYAKEISEAFAMVDALERGIKLTFGVGIGDLQNPVTCYCLGDGKYPVGAAALELFLPKSSQRWKYIAIDPLLPKRLADDNDVGDNATSMYHERIELYSGFSQNFSIQTRSMDNNDITDAPPMLSIAIACHSHAPLEEFWERMPNPKLCVALPCCAQFSELLKETPILEYDNFEVYSAKRRIKIFAST